MRGFLFREAYVGCETYRFMANLGMMNCYRCKAGSLFEPVYDDCFQFHGEFGLNKLLELQGRLPP